LPRRLAPPARAGSGRPPLDPQSRTYALRRRRRPGGERKSRGSAGEAGPGKGFLLLMKLTKICYLGGRRGPGSERSRKKACAFRAFAAALRRNPAFPPPAARRKDRKSTRLNSSHVKISYAVFC